MKNFALQCFRKISSILYLIIGPENSTKLSHSGFGKAVISSFIVGKRTDSIYSGVDGIKLKLSQAEALSSGFIHLGVINPHETKIIKQILKEGDIFFDIGAYVDGWHSIVASKLVGNNGKIYTFEPVPEYFNKLVNNISLNKLKNVIVEKLAVADKNGKRTFYIGGLASTLYKDHLSKNEIIDRVTVSTITLDSYIIKNKIKNISLLKIDVEGAEMDTINGARNLLKRNDAPDLMIEVSDVYLHHGNTSENALLDTLKELGYKAYSITSQGLARYVKKSSGRELMNVYFSKKAPRNLPLS